MSEVETGLFYWRVIERVLFLNCVFFVLQKDPDEKLPKHAVI